MQQRYDLTQDGLSQDKTNVPRRDIFEIRDYRFLNISGRNTI